LDSYTKDDLDYINNPSNNWSCPSCLADHFPFPSIDVQGEFIELLSPAQAISYSPLDELLFNPFDIDEEEGVLDDIDPDENFYNSP
jgi:hypothetical protein